MTMFNIDILLKVVDIFSYAFFVIFGFSWMYVGYKTKSSIRKRMMEKFSRTGSFDNLSVKKIKEDFTDKSDVIYNNKFKLFSLAMVSGVYICLRQEGIL